MIHKILPKSPTSTSYFWVTFYVIVFHVRGAPSPLEVGAFSLLVPFNLALARLAFCLKKTLIKNKK